MEELTNAFADSVDVSGSGASMHKEPRIRQWKSRFTVKAAFYLILASSKYGDQKLVI